LEHVIVTGGAGYIGSHACKALKIAGYVPVTLDNLSTGWQDAVKFGPFEHVDLMDRAAIDAFCQKRLTTCMRLRMPMFGNYSERF